MDKIDLSDFFITKSQATDFTVRLNAILDQMYTTNFNFEQTLAQQFGVQKRDIFMKLLRDHNMTNVSTTALQEFLKKIQDTVSNLPTISMVLAFEPNADTLHSLSQWFLFNLNKQVLFDIQVDPKLIAGVKITFNGKYKDYSLEPLFDQLIEKMLHPEPSKPALHQNEQLITIGR